MSKPIIGITANQRINNSQDNTLWSYVPTDVINSVAEAGGLPLMLPIGDVTSAIAYVSMVDKIIVIGGQNVDPYIYGEGNHALDDDFLEERDNFELAIINESLARKKPLFTICRGTQLMNVALGGNLYQDIKGHWQPEVAQAPSHEVVFEEGSVLRDIYGQYSTINSIHRQSIKKLATPLEAIAYAPDHTIEAVTFKNQAFPFLGVQWHPELLAASRPQDQALFNYVVNKL